MSNIKANKMVISLRTLMLCCGILFVLLVPIVRGGTEWDAPEGIFREPKGIRYLDQQERDEYLEIYRRIKPRLVNGKRELIAGKKEKARHEFRRVCDLYEQINWQWPNTVEAIKAKIQSAYSLRESGATQEAVTLLSQMISQYTGTKYEAIARFALGRIHQLEGDPNASTSEFEALVEKYPKSRWSYQAYITLAGLSLGKSDRDLGVGNYAEAIAYLDRVGPEAPQIYFIAQLNTAAYCVESWQYEDGFAKFAQMRKDFDSGTRWRYHKRIDEAEKAARVLKENRDISMGILSPIEEMILQSK